MERKIYAVIDTETCGGAAQEYCPTYDFAVKAFDSAFNYVDEMRILILPNMRLSSTFYGKKKKDFYLNALKNENVVIAFSEEEALKMVEEWLTINGVDCICAFNSAFDFERTFISEIASDYEFIDLFLAFAQTIGAYKKYQNFCYENGYLTKKYKRPRMTAEICYRYLTNNTDFVESHTAMEDVDIESIILKAILDSHRKFSRNEHGIKNEEKTLTTE